MSHEPEADGLRPIPAWVGVTYLIYIIAWMTLAFGTVAYAVFVLGHSGWWFALSVFLLTGTYRPGRWAEVVTGDTGPTWEDRCKCHGPRALARDVLEKNP